MFASTLEHIKGYLDKRQIDEEERAKAEAELNAPSDEAALPDELPGWIDQSTGLPVHSTTPEACRFNDFKAGFKLDLTTPPKPDPIPISSDEDAGKLDPSEITFDFFEKDHKIKKPRDSKARFYEDLQVSDDDNAVIEVTRNREKSGNFKPTNAPVRDPEQPTDYPPRTHHNLPTKLAKNTSDSDVPEGKNSDSERGEENVLDSGMSKPYTVVRSKQSTSKVKTSKFFAHAASSKPVEPQSKKSIGFSENEHPQETSSTASESDFVKKQLVAKAKRKNIVTSNSDSEISSEICRANERQRMRSFSKKAPSLFKWLRYNWFDVILTL